VNAIEDGAREEWCGAGFPFYKQKKQFLGERCISRLWQWTVGQITMWG